VCPTAEETEDCYLSGDMICDTNPQKGPTDYIGGACPPQTQCGHPSPYTNFMDYTSPRDCLEEFTEEQARRMRCVIQHYRPNVLWNSPPMAPPAPPPPPAPLGHSCETAHPFGDGSDNPSLLITSTAGGSVGLARYTRKLCHGTYFTGEGDVYWLRLANVRAGAEFTLTACGFDTDLSIFVGSCGSSNMVACNGDATFASAGCANMCRTPPRPLFLRPSPATSNPCLWS